MRIKNITDPSLQKLFLFLNHHFKFVLLPGVLLLLFGCVQPPTIPQNGTNVTVLREPSNPLETLALCNTPVELKYACNVDSDCICEGAFTGNKIYYNSYCADKSAIVSDSCGGVGGPRPVACVDHVCTLSYPKQGWTFEKCNELTSEVTRILCKRELALQKSNSEATADFCNLLPLPETEFDQTDCKDLFYRTLAWNAKNYTACDKIVTSEAKRDCKDLVISEMIRINGTRVNICQNISYGDDFSESDCENIYRIYEIIKPSGG